MKIFIMSWNWLSSLQKQVDYFLEAGHTPIIVDNCSTYPPLLKYLESNPCKVISTRGHVLSTYNRFIFELLIPETQAPGENYYAVTDSDLDLTTVPKDLCNVLIADIERSEGIIKSGLSIRIEDLPRNTYSDRYRDAERNNWSQQDSHGFYGIAVDTTFAVYSKSRCSREGLEKMWRPSGSPAPDNFLDNFYFYRSHRSPEPYTCKHLPWYMDINNLSDQEQYHIKVCAHGSVLFFKQTYAKELLEKYGITEHQIYPSKI